MYVFFKILTQRYSISFLFKGIVLTLLTLIVFSSICPLHAQSGTWVYWGGTHNDNGRYGTQGIFSSLNAPAGRDGAANWTDKDGNFWLFGGESDSLGESEYFNDLWEYNPIKHQWAWINGPQYQANVTGSFGTKGIPSVHNLPSARCFGANWIDKIGDLWLFGGVGYDSSGGANRMNDLWHYHIATNEWTWMGGSAYSDSTSKYGKMTIASKYNWPGARGYTNATWVDDNNNLWIFGGDGYPAKGKSTISLNDLWKYNINSGEWTWMKGVDSTLKIKYSFGTRAVEENSNLPPPRQLIVAHWQDGNGNFYLYGGNMASGMGSSLVWKYNTYTNNWTWIEGTINWYDTGLWVSKCQSGANNEPGASQGSATPQTIGCQNVYWSFGGRSGFGYYSNELWAFNARTLEWTWISGHHFFVGSDTGYYNSVGIASTLNQIPSRAYMSLWTDKNQHFWVFSGDFKNFPISGGGICNTCTSNDMWEYIPDTSCFHAELGVDMVNGKDTTICGGHRIIYSTKYMPAAYCVPAADSVRNIDTLVFVPKTTTTYTVYYNNTGCDGKSAIRFTIYVKQAPVPHFSISPLKVSTQSAQVHLHNLNKDAGTQSWLLNGNICTHSITDTFINLPPVAGKHCISLIIKSDTNNCIDTLTKCVQVIDTALIFVPTAFSPNGDGTNDVLYAITPSAHVTLKTFKIYNRWGQQVFESQSFDKGWDGTFNNQPEPVGTYVYYVEAITTTNGSPLFTKGTVTLVR